MEEVVYCRGGRNKREEGCPLPAEESHAGRSWAEESAWFSRAALRRVLAASPAVWASAPPLRMALQTWGQQGVYVLQACFSCPHKGVEEKKLPSNRGELQRERTARAPHPLLRVLGPWPGLFHISGV